MLISAEESVPSTGKIIKNFKITQSDCIFPCFHYSKGKTLIEVQMEKIEELLNGKAIINYEIDNSKCDAEILGIEFSFINEINFTNNFKGITRINIIEEIGVQSKQNMKGKIEFPLRKIEYLNHTKLEICDTVGVNFKSKNIIVINLLYGFYHEDTRIYLPIKIYNTNEN